MSAVEILVVAIVSGLGACSYSSVCLRLTSLYFLARREVLQHRQPNMAPNVGKKVVSQRILTESNLAMHNSLEESGEPDGSVVSWMEKVIIEEQTHIFHSQLGIKCSNLRNQGSIDIEQAMDQLSQAVSGSNTDQMSGSLKLFEQQQQRGACRETPLERFLSPDGCSDLSYFARPALAQMGTRFGDMEGREKRREKAKENVDSMASNKRQKGVKKG